MAYLPTFEVEIVPFGAVEAKLPGFIDKATFLWFTATVGIVNAKTILFIMARQRVSFHIYSGTINCKRSTHRTQTERPNYWVWRSRLSYEMCWRYRHCWRRPRSPLERENRWKWWKYFQCAQPFLVRSPIPTVYRLYKWSNNNSYTRSTDFTRIWMSTHDVMYAYAPPALWCTKAMGCSGSVIIRSVDVDKNCNGLTTVAPGSLSNETEGDSTIWNTMMT